MVTTFCKPVKYLNPFCTTKSITTICIHLLTPFRYRRIKEGPSSQRPHYQLQAASPLAPATKQARILKHVDVSAAHVTTSWGYQCLTSTKSVDQKNQTQKMPWSHGNPWRWYKSQTNPLHASAIICMDQEWKEMANSGGYPFRTQKNDFFNQAVLLKMACFDQLSKYDFLYQQLGHQKKLQFFHILATNYISKPFCRPTTHSTDSVN